MQRRFQRAMPNMSLPGKRINENTVETSVMKAAEKEVERTRSVVTKDGKTITITSKGWDAQAKPYSLVTVWEKQ